MARRKLFAENLAAAARGIALMLAGILLFGENQGVVIPNDDEITQAILAAIWLFAGAILVMPEERR